MTVLTTLRSESASLVRDEVRAAAQRERLMQAAVQAVKRYGYSVAEVSAETGLMVDEITAAMAAPALLDDSLAKLAGLR